LFILDNFELKWVKKIAISRTDSHLQQLLLDRI